MEERRACCGNGLNEIVRVVEPHPSRNMIKRKGCVKCKSDNMLRGVECINLHVDCR